MDKFKTRGDMYEWLGDAFGRFVAEIGVWRGDNAAVILERAKPKLLVLIDRWKKVDEPTNQDMMSLPKAVIERAYLDVVARFVHRREVIVARLESMTALGVFGSVFDWVYIDATHTREAVEKDVVQWGRYLERLGVPAVVAGHDYGSRRHPGVKQAIDGLVRTEQFKLIAITDDYPASYALEVIA